MNSRLKFFVVVASTCVVVLLLVGAVMGGNNPQEGPYRHLAVYTEVLSRIKSDYVEEPDMKSVTMGALNGMLEALDPYASYLSADQYKQYLKTSQSDKADVGLVLSRRYGYVGIVDAIPGSPAAKTGLTTGDVLEAIKGVSTRDMPLAYAEQLLRGDAGTSVDVSVLRLRKPEPQKMTLVREAVAYPPVASRMLKDDIGYLQVQSVAGSRVAEINAALAELTKQGAKKLVLDVRHSSTGGPAEGLALANLFLDKGLLGYLQGQKVPRQDFQADPTKTVWRLPLVVITNRGTSNGAEVATAALLDNKRAEVVGERTYGNAALRRSVPMEDGSAILLAVAKYHSPSGKAIQDGGVAPSVLTIETDLAEDLDEEGTPVQPAKPETPRSPDQDILLKKAIEVLTTGVPADARSIARKDGAAAPERRDLLPNIVHRPPKQ
jgi:carboxyl-terminal processing protease